MQTEQRACERLSVVKNAYAALRAGTFKVGKIQNISMSGLMFSYIGLDIPENTTTEVDLFIVQENIYLPNLPCKVVHSVTRKSKNKELSFAYSRCGLSIGTLEKKKKKNLEKFINNSTKI
jgi:hypothetical protein